MLKGLFVGLAAALAAASVQSDAVGGVSGGVVSAQFVAEDWRIVDVAFRSIVKPGLVEGEISGVRITGVSGGTTFRLSISRAPDRSWRLWRDAAPLGGWSVERQLERLAGAQLRPSL